VIVPDDIVCCSSSLCAARAFLPRFLIRNRFVSNLDSQRGCHHSRGDAGPYVRIRKGSVRREEDAVTIEIDASDAVEATHTESPDDLLKAAEIALIGGLIGARLYYVLFNLDYYQTQPWWRIFAVWEGGLAIHGGLIGRAEQAFGRRVARVTAAGVLAERMLFITGGGFSASVRNFIEGMRHQISPEYVAATVVMVTAPKGSAVVGAPTVAFMA
jgi:hypothetical protein